MESKEQAQPLTLARMLGDTTHVSALLRRICQLSGLEQGQVGQWLLKCAIERGARHYICDFTTTLPQDRPELSDEEVGVGLCLGHHLYNAFYLRAAAQLLSSPQVDAQRLALLAEMERVEPVLLHITDVAARFAPTLEPWAFLRSRLRRRLAPSKGALPHWSRFVNQTGVTPFGGGPAIEWLFREEPAK